MKKLYEESSVQAIANAIRTKAGTATTYKIAEMPDAISNLPSGGGATEPYMEEVYDSDGNLIDAKLYGYTKIRDYLFYNCMNLALTSLPAGITSIGDSAFSICINLTSITFEGTPTTIASNAFNYCTNLTTINVPWAEGAVANAPWGATYATINYNYTEG